MQEIQYIGLVWCSHVLTRHVSKENTSACNWIVLQHAHDVYEYIAEGLQINAPPQEISGWGSESGFQATY